jgi:hypothetical protein
VGIAQVFRVEFEVRKASAGPGKADTYRRGPRTALVQAASAHPKDILVPLTNNVTLLAGESIDILAVTQVAVGSEGSGVLQ